MRLFFRFFLLVFFLFCVQNVLPQNGLVTGLNGTEINVPCGSNCNTLKVQVPHLKTTDDYSVQDMRSTSYEYVTSAPSLVHPCTTTGNAQDDKFLDTTKLPFRFCFYGETYGQLAIGTNGVISFDSTNALRGNNYVLNGATTIPFAGAGSQGNGSCPSPSGALFPRAAIMGAYYDIFPRATDPDYKIEARAEGAAPYRRFIISYFKIPPFGCLNTRGSSQIVLYESTGMIEVYIGEKPDCNSNSGLAVLGIQNWERDKGIAAPGKNATRWTESNTAYRFIPSGRVSRFVKAELYDLAGLLLQTTTPADTATTTPGMLDINFNNICFTGAFKQFVVKSYFSDCNGIQSLSANDTITVTKGDLVTTTSSTPVGCSAGGTATITLPPGAGPYSFAIGSNAPVASPDNTYTFTGLIAGNYTVTGTNAAGCGATATVSVGLNGILNIQATPRATSCSGLNDGQIMITPQNGTPPFQYNINNGSFQASNTFTNLAPATYVVGVKDASGCVAANHLVTVVAGGAVTASLSQVNVSCNGGNNGNVTVGLSGNAVPPLQYSLDGITFQSSNTFSGLGAATYTVHFKDANNCGGTQNFTITQPAVLSLSLIKQDALCNGQSSGKITVNASGGTPGYQYSIDGVAYQATNTFSVGASAYTVYVKDAAGCITTEDIIINQPASLSVTAQTENATCNGGADGKITATAGGGQPGYQFSIDGTLFHASNVFNVVKNNYVLTVKDANGCLASAGAVVNLTNNLTLALSADTTICEGTAASLSATTNATQLLWSQGVSLNDATIANPLASPNNTTEYVLTAILGACSVKDSLTVYVNPAPVADAGLNDEICFGQGYVLQGSGGIAFEWSPTTYFNTGITATSQNPAVTPLRTTSYSLLVTDAQGCRSLVPATVRITVTPPIKVAATPKDTVVSRGDVIQLRATSPVTDYIWSPVFGLDNPAAQNPIATIDRDVEYYVTAYTGAGCKGTDTVRMKVYNGPEIYVPTAFTPNGDGRNDLLMPFPVGIKELHFFRVYNRWGGAVFETKTLSHGWDGKVGGRLQPTGTYVWVLEAVTKENRIVKKKGTSTLIR